MQRDANIPQMQALSVQKLWLNWQRPMANIDLITGFLGAGKTTFIRKYAKYLDFIGESYVVIENEYGSKGIDSQILKADGITTKELFGGCICCTLKVGFHDMLLALSDKVDRIIVEPSGVYDISQFFAVMSSDALRKNCNIGNVICVVDPTNLSKLDDLSVEILRHQVQASGTVIFSMSEDECYIPKFKELVGGDFRITGYDDLASIYNCGYNKSDFAAELTHSAEYLSTFIKPLPCEDMMKRLQKLFSTAEAGRILRIKGFWNGYLINAIDGHIEINKCDGEEGLNVIGLNISRRKIKEVLNDESDRKEN